MDAGTSSPLVRKSRFREPFSGFSHLIGAILSTIALVVLLTLGHTDPWRTASFLIYGGSLILLYSASAVYHLYPGSPQAQRWLQKFDHVGIFLLIAGTYTPVCLATSLRGPWGWGMMAIVWSLAVIGSGVVLFWNGAPIWLDFVLYILMGWMAVIALGPISHAVSGAAFHWLIIGGVLYTVGAVFYATEKPRLWPGIFDAHDLWHLFVLGGSISHFIMILTFAVPGTR